MTWLIDISISYKGMVSPWQLDSKKALIDLFSLLTYKSSTNLAVLLEEMLENVHTQEK